MAKTVLPILPFEIIMTILLMLPMDNLIRLTCVCKAWRNLIRNREFMRRHFELCASRGNGYLFCCPKEFGSKKSFKFLSDKCHLNVFENEIPFGFDSDGFALVHASNGLVCLTAVWDFNVTIYLSNPFIRKCKTISSSSIDVSSKDFTSLILGFGYHGQANDYKIVRIAYVEKYYLYGGDNSFIDICDVDVNEVDSSSYSYGFYAEDSNINYDDGFSDTEVDLTVGSDFLHEEDNENDFPNRINDTEVEVYSLSTDTWRKIEVKSFPWFLNDSHSRALVNDSLHWIGHFKDEFEMRTLILSFDLENEGFQEIGLPYYQEYDAVRHGNNVVVYKDKLSFLAFYPVGYKGICSMWVMKEYGVLESWSKLFTITDQPIHDPFTLTWHDEILLDGEEENVILYNFLNHEHKVLQLDDESKYWEFLPVTESLVLPMSNKELPEDSTQTASVIEQISLLLLGESITGVDCKSAMENECYPSIQLEELEKDIASSSDGKKAGAVAMDIQSTAGYVDDDG